MTLATDGHHGDGRFSANAERMLALQEQVMSEWTKRLREAVKEARALSHPILINTFPLLYGNLAQAISPDYPRKPYENNNTIASEHGGERARLTDYNAQAVISEYQVLRWTIFDVLQEAGVQLDNRECHIINTTIDSAVRDSISAFELAQASLRERFVAALAHDLRNPLMAAYAAAELIRLGKTPENMPKLASRILDNLGRMDTMIRELLDVVVFQSGERLRLHICHFDLSAVAAEVAEQANALYGQHIQLDLQPAEGWWDREAIKRAIENLLGNAVKYGLPDSAVHLSITMLHERIALSVHNEGDPIPPEQMETVFQVFQRSHAAREGSTEGWGIGLPYVRTVAESHGGSVVIDSAIERGTTFTLDLPLDSRPYQNAPVL